MKTSKAQATAGALCASLLLLTSTPVLSQSNDSNSIEAVVDTLFPVSTSREMCVDTQPLSDGFGWNGTCTCRVPGSDKMFGRTIVTDGNKLIVGSEEAPNSCIGSGVANVYQIQTDGSLAKEAELVSSGRLVGDDFPLYSDLAGDYLAVGSREVSAIVPGKVTVFSFDGSSWNERYFKEIADRSDPFEINGEELVATTAANSNEVTVFDINDGSVLQTIPANCPSSVDFPAVSSFDLIDDVLSINSFCGNDPGDIQRIEVFRRNATGEYVTTASFDSIRGEQRVLYELLEFTEGRKILLPDRFGSQNASMVEIATDTWSIVEPFDIQSADFSVHEGQLFIVDTFFTPNSPALNTLHVYDLDAEGRNWVQTQELNFERDYVGIATSIEFEGDKLSVVRSTRDVDDTRPRNATASLFEKDEANRWGLVFEQDFVGRRDRGGTSSSFAGNNLFLAMAENEVRNIRFGQANSNGTESNPGNVSTNSCDYSNAALYGGWGWNETTRESCPPLTEAMEQPTTEVPAGCDYSNADLSGGWGWNETTRESCAPLTETMEQPTAEVPAGCDYSNAALSGGWGWNETTRESCPPL